jgi:hypothetical protein
MDSRNTPNTSAWNTPDSVPTMDMDDRDPDDSDDIICVMIGTCATCHREYHQPGTCGHYEAYRYCPWCGARI